MAYKIIPHFLSRWFMPVGRDANDDLRIARVDANGGLFAGAFGTFYDTWHEVILLTASGTQTLYLYTSSVPSGFLYVVQSVSLTHNDSTGRGAIIAKLYQNQEYQITRDSNLPPYVSLNVHTEIVLKEGELIRGVVFDVSDTRYAVMCVVGYKVKL